MSDIPPYQPEPMIDPPIIAPARTRGWPYALLLFIFVCLIGLSLMSLKNPERGKESVQQLELSLKISLMTNAVGSLPSSTKTAPVVQNAPLEKVVEDAKKHPASLHAARVRLAAEHELKKKPAETALALLRKSKEASDRNFARIYESDKMTVQQAEQWSPTEKSFSSQLARGHAFAKAGNPSIRSDLLSMKTYAPILVASVAGMAAFGLGCLFLIGFIVFSRRPSWPFQDLEIPTPEGGDRFAIRASVAMGAYFFIGLVAAILELNEVSPIIANLVLIGGWLGITVAFLRVPVWGVADSWKSVMGDGDRKPLKAALGAAGFFANLPILLVVVAVVSVIAPYLPEPTHPVTTELASGKPEVIAMSFFMAAIMAPILEETIFRGLIMRALMGLFGRPWPAIFLQGFLFAAIHPQGPAGWLPLMAIGCMCGWVTWRSGSLWPAMILHFVHNSVLLVVSTLIL